MDMTSTMEGPEQLYPLVLELSVPDQRESALLELSKKREEFPELAPILWHSFGTVAALLQEIVSIYPLLSPPQLTAHASNRVCNALALLQCVASHSETRTHFLNGRCFWIDRPRAGEAAPPSCCGWMQYGEGRSALCLCCTNDDGAAL